MDYILEILNMALIDLTVGHVILGVAAVVVTAAVIAIVDVMWG